MHIKFEENGVCKGFQIATQKSIQNSERDKMLMWQIRRELALVYQGTLMLTAPLKGAASASVSWYTSASFPFLNSSYK